MEESEIKDRKIPCKTCQKDFVWTASEQRYYQKKGFKKQPQKCSDCREKANKLRNENMFYIHCGICDKNAVMIAPPPKDRVAICSDCYEKFVKEFQENKAKQEPSTNSV
jgi:hypothetical protein